jgi:hypothetical protein
MILDYLKEASALIVKVWKSQTNIPRKRRSPWRPWITELTRGFAPPSGLFVPCLRSIVTWRFSIR